MNQIQKRVPYEMLPLATPAGTAGTHTRVAKLVDYGQNALFFKTYDSNKAVKAEVIFALSLLRQTSH